MLEACLVGDVDVLPEVSSRTSAWSPNMLVGSLAELTEAVAERDDALTDVAVDVDTVDVRGNKGFLEYRFSAAFSGPFVVDEQLTIEPNGHVLLLGACLAADFRGDKIAAFRNYFDNVTLLGQMLAA